METHRDAQSVSRVKGTNIRTRLVVHAVSVLDQLAELRQECDARGLGTKGNKGELIARLQAYLEEHGETRDWKNGMFNVLQETCFIHAFWVTMGGLTSLSSSYQPIPFCPTEEDVDVDDVLVEDAEVTTDSSLRRLRLGRELKLPFDFRTLPNLKVTPL